MTQKPASDVACIPPCPIEHYMVAAMISQPHDTQRLGDGAFTWCKDRTGNQHKDVVPDRRHYFGRNTA